MAASTTRQKPYEALARIYDYVMRHVDYDKWGTYIDALLQRFEHRPQNLVDLACGTGNIALVLHDLGYPVTGVDGSAAMIEVGREKAASAGKEIEFLQRDLRHLDELGSFDAAVCIYDSFNYLLTLEDIHRALGETYRILRPDSLFVFDVCTERNSLRHFRELTDAEEGPGFSYQRHSHYDRNKQLQINHFHIRFESPDREWEEIHTQRIYPLEEIVAQIEASPFDLLGGFSGFTLKRGSERSDRVHFVLRRPPV